MSGMILLFISLEKLALRIKITYFIASDIYFNIQILVKKRDTILINNLAKNQSTQIY